MYIINILQCRISPPYKTHFYIGKKRLKTQNPHKLLVISLILNQQTILSHYFAAFPLAIPGPSTSSPSPKVLKIAGSKTYGRRKQLFSETSMYHTINIYVKIIEYYNYSFPAYYYHLLN